MPYITSIERLGREEGRYEATANLLIRQLQKRFPEFTGQDETAIRALPLARLELLGEAVLDFTAIEELREWLASSARG